MKCTKIRSELLLASINSTTGDIVYTFKWVYPRIILSEVNTHRMLSRNTSSSRAIPGKKQRERVLQDPFIPISIGAAKKGMQAGPELTGAKRWLAEKVWAGARYPAIGSAWLLDKLGAHKQVSNRLVEPWTWTTQLVTATDLDNLFKLRCDSAAEPHFQELALQARLQADFVAYLLKKELGKWDNRAGVIIRDYEKSTDTKLQILMGGQWHLPFIEPEDEVPWNIYQQKRISAARCARVSYNMPNTNKKSTYSEDFRLAEDLITDGHMSPFEHQATPMATSHYKGNFKGWCQYRWELERWVD